jgi:hypothetical protein
VQSLWRYVLCNKLHCLRTMVNYFATFCLFSRFIFNQSLRMEV